MGNITELKDLSKSEKLIMMEALWEDLSRDDNQVDSPDWHKTSLHETKKRLSSGEEKIIDWVEAKRQLRKRFNED
ncbi:MAG TPA: addiction module protein [Spirochaetota bacterium]|nr:addiction module protein [Spirochaetota bacterium]HRZ28786.1 addiction module protein [Spirochaetota bacterium]HSA16582.1 addiction module protein [Spirochaetota bacterium]